MEIRKSHALKECRFQDFQDFLLAIQTKDNEVNHIMAIYSNAILFKECIVKPVAKCIFLTKQILYSKWLPDVCALKFASPTPLKLCTEI